MSKAAKIIILILFLLLGGSVYMVLSTLSQKQILEKTKTDLQSQLSQVESRELKVIAEKRKLDDQLTSAESIKTQLQNQVNSLNDQIKSLSSQVASVSAERDDWKNRLDGIKKERDDLMAKLMARPSEPAVVKVVEQPGQVTSTGTPKPGTTPATGDERYWADVFKEKADLALQIDNLKSELNQRNLELAELKKQNSDFKLELDGLKSQKEDIERKIKYGRDLADSLSMDLARARNDRQYAIDKMEKLQKDNYSLRGEIKSLSNTKIALEKSIARLNEDKSTIAKKLAETEGLIQGRIDEIWQVKDSLDKSFQAAKQSSLREVELPPIIVNAPGRSAARSSGETPGFNGKVVSVNEDNNFVIVDLGENAGIQVGENLSVYRGSEYIGKLEVIQIRKDISAADIRQRVSPIKVGDMVR